MRILLAFIFLIISNFCFSQTDTWEDMMGDPNISLFEIQEAYNNYWTDLENIPGGAGHKPYKRWEYLRKTRVDENGFFNPLQRQKVFQKYLASGDYEKATTNAWVAIGPSDEPAGNNGIGRINVIAIHPTTATTIFVGTPAGGLWKSTDGGSSWSTNTDLLTNLGVSDIVFDPANANTMYLVTGDRDHNDTSTYGILKSTDGGNTWATTAFQPGTSGLPNFYLIHRLLIDPGNGNIMVASTTSGVFRTTDAWATWTEVLPNDCLRHMERHPTNSNIIYGTTSGNYCGGLNPTAEFFRSTNNGISWSAVSLSNSGDHERIGIGVAGNEVFLCAATNDSSNSNDFTGLYKSTNSGASFTEVTVTNVPDLGSQQWYDWSFTVDPNNSNIMYAGGVHIEKSTNGGTTWTRVSNNGSNNVHVDHHFAKFFGSTLWVGSDGGIWSTTNGASSWNNHNDGLAITQYYRMSNAETDASIVLTGSQDNGTHQLKNGNWIYEFGGDGMDNAIDPNDEDNLFVSYQYGNFFRSTNGGGNFSGMINSNTTGTSGAWVTPIKIDEVNTSTLYVGYDKIWKSTNDGLSWSAPSSTPLTSGSSRLQYIDISKSNPSTVYTTNYNSIWKTTNGGVNWSATTDPGSNIRWIEIDPTDQNHVWICRANDVMESTNGGNTWTDISSNLPNISMNTLVYDPTGATLYVGSDLGVWGLDDGATTWSTVNNSLPNVIVLELDILESSNIMRAATFGRGAWEVPLGGTPMNCSVDNIVDLGIASCNAANSLYTRNVQVEYTNAPSTGFLIVNGQWTSITSSPQTVTLINLPADGASVDVTVSFSDDSACTLTETSLFVNPTIQVYFADADGDGFGDGNTGVSDCEQPAGYVTNDSDCDDNDANNYPGNTEICDGQDNDCDGLIDEGAGTQTFYQDSDGDGFGNINVFITACVAPAGYVSNNTDCDDTDDSNYPGNTEICDGQDNNCDGQIDEGLSVNTYYADADGDGFGDSNNSMTSCSQPTGFVSNNTDCDDNDSNNYPGNTEVCDGQDNDCDGLVDENVSNTYYADTDGDGFGDSNNSTTACSLPAGYVSNSTDCDDNDSNNYPGNTEVCDGQDNNCDGVVDEGCGSGTTCDGAFLVISNITQNTYRADINIVSTANVNGSNSILYTAGVDIDLDPPFEVALGTPFEARIEPCTPFTTPGEDGNSRTALDDLTININQTFEVSEDVNVSLKDAKGNLIRKNKYKSQASYLFDVILKDMPEGIYQLEFTDGDKIIEEQVVIKN